jgi:hypothetical protein
MAPSPQDFPLIIGMHRSPVICVLYLSPISFSLTLITFGKNPNYEALH